MKFTAAWSELASQNTALKIGCLSLATATALLGVQLVRLASKDPLIIERVCFSKAIQPASTTRPKSEVEAFIKEALHERFDSDAIDTQLLSVDEQSFRIKEQKELSQRQMSQRVFVNNVSDDGSHIDSDRLISIGKIRSAFPFSLNVQLTQTPRSESNPYGLILDSVKADKEEPKK